MGYRSHEDDDIAPKVLVDDGEHDDVEDAEEWSKEYEGGDKEGTVPPKVVDSGDDGNEATAGIGDEGDDKGWDASETGAGSAKGDLFEDDDSD